METQQAQKWRWLIFVAACLETFLFGGIVFGWGSLVYVLKQDGVFSHLCVIANNSTTNSQTLRSTINEVTPNNMSRGLGLDALTQIQTAAVDAQSSTAHTIAQPTVTMPIGSDAWKDGVTSGTLTSCVEQDNMLSLCFSMSAGILYTAASINGGLSYKVGTRITRLVGWLSFTVGGLLTAFTSHDNPWLLFLGLPLLGYGGTALLITNIQVGALFSTGSSTVIAALSGLFDTSSVVMLFVKFASEGGLSRQGSLLILSGLHTLSLLSTLLLMPSGHFSWREEAETESIFSRKGSLQNVTDSQLLSEGVEGDITKDGTDTEAKDAKLVGDKSEDAKTGTRSTGALKTKRKPVPTLRQCMCSVLFLMQVSWTALLQLRFSYFLGSLNPWLFYRLQTKEKVSHFTNVSMYSMICGLPISLASGALFDFFKHLFSKQKSVAHCHFYSTIAMLCVVSSIAVLMSVAILVPTEGALYASCMLTAILRSFIYSVDANVITHIFPPQYFGALFGVSDFVGGAVSLLQYALVVWHENAGFNTVNTTMLAVSAVTFVHPVVQLCRGVKTKETNNQQLQSLAGNSTALPQSDDNGEAITL